MASPPIITLAGRATSGTAVVGLNELVNISQFISITPTDGDVVTFYDYFDGNGASYSAVGYVAGVGYGTQGLGYHINAQAIPLSNLFIQGGTFTSNDVITIRAYDANGYSEIQFVVQSRGANTAPVVTPTGLAVETGSSVLAASLISTYDAEGDSPTLYRFWDPTGGGYFTLNGVAQTSGQNIDVSAANLYNLSYVAGATRGTETLWAQVYDGQAWSQWVSWTQLTRNPGNTPTVVQDTARAIQTGQWVRASDLGLVTSDADGDLPVRYTFIDHADGNTRLWYGGAYVQQNSSITIQATELSSLWVQAGGITGATTFGVQVHDGYVWSNTGTLTVNARGPNSAPTVAATGATVAVNASVAAASLITTADVDGDAITRYRFWDPAGSGVFKLSGVAQASGQNIEFSAADLANLTYAGGATAGRETLWAQVYDGQAWSAWASWSQQTVRNSNTLSVVNAGNRNLSLGQWIRAADLSISVTDADGDTPVQYRFTDLNVNAASARMWMGGTYKAQGDIVTINAADLVNLWIQAGPAAALDGFTVEVNDGYGWSNAAAFDVVTRQPNRAPVVAGAGISVAVGGSALATSLITVTDADGDTPTLYRFWDPAGGGVFKLNGVAQTAGQNLDVAAADIANLRYFGSAPAGRETLWAQVYDGTDWSAWTQWSQQTVRNGNTLPVASASNRNLSPAQWVKASDLAISVTDADGDAPTQYRFTDGNSGAGSAQLWFGGGFVTQGGTVTVSAADLGALWLQGATANGTDAFTVEVNDGFGWSNAAAFNVVTRPPNRAPVVAGAGTTVAVGGNALATSLINITDADGDTPTLYRFWDPSGGGVFKLNGVAQAANQNLDVAAADIANLRYYGGATAGRETLWVQVYDGTDWSAWASWSQQTVRNGNTLSVVSAANRNLTASQWIRASELSITVTDADGDAPTQYRFTDTNTTAGSAQLWQAGGFVAQGGTVTVSAGDLANLWIQGANSTITDGFTVDVNDGFGWSNAAAFNVATRGPNRAPVVGRGAGVVHVSQGTNAAALVAVSDADGDSPTLYRFWDPAGGGHLIFNGAAQAAGANFDVAADQLSQVQFVGGAAASVSDTLWVQAYDGQAWSAWASLDTMAHLPIPAAEVLGTAGADFVNGQSGAIHFGGPADDIFSSRVAYAAYVGGSGRDFYGIPGPNIGASITFVFDGDSDAGDGDQLVFTSFDFFQTQNSGAALIDGTTLVLTDKANNRVVVLPNWNDPNTGGIDIFRDGATLLYDRAGMANLLAQHSNSVETLTWENLGLDAGEMRQAIAGWFARAPVNEATIRINALRETFRAIGSVPYNADFLPSVGTRGDDNRNTFPYHGYSTYLGRQGDDQFSGSPWDSTGGTGVGGAGADAYQAIGLTSVAILDAGSSNGDSLLLRADDLRHNAAVVDGRHLLIRNVSDGNAVTTLLDWRDPANRIESITVTSRLANNLFDTRIYSFDEFAALIDSYSLPTLAWEDFGATTAHWNAYINLLVAQNTAAAANIIPAVTDRHGTIGPRTRTTFDNLIGMQDADGGLYQQLTVRVGGHATLYFDGARYYNGASFATTPGDLSRYSVVTDGTVSTLILTVTASDGYDSSFDTSVIVNALMDQTPVVSTLGQTLTGAEKRALSAFFSVTDDDADPITRYEVGVPTGGILWRDGVRLGNATTTIESADISHYQLSSDGVAGSLSVGVRAYDGYAWGAQTSVTATVSNPLPPAPTSGFGLQAPAKALGNVGTVVSGVLIPHSEAFRLDSIVRIDPNQAASILGYEFQAIGTNTGWSQGAYLQIGSTILTSGQTIDYFAASLDPQTYLHARFYTEDTEYWQVRAQTGVGTWTDWTSFYVTTTPSGNANFLPVDNAPQNGRAITLGANPTAFDDWVGVTDLDAYTFSVAAAGTLHLDFSNLYDSVSVKLERVTGQNLALVSPTAVAGAVIDRSTANVPVASAATVAAGGSADFSLSAGSYQLSIGAAISPLYFNTVVGNTTYHLAASFQ